MTKRANENARRGWLAALAAFALAGAPACVGNIPAEGGAEAPDAGADPDPDPDPPDPDPDPDPPAPESLDVSGQSMDYWESAAIAGVVLEAQGMVDPLGQPFVSTSDAGGAFTFADVPAASTFYVHASLESDTLDYRPTVNEPAAVVDEDLVQDFYIVSEAFVAVNNSTLNLPVEPLTSLVVGDLRNALGLPLEGIPLADISLTNALGEPVGAGPYFFGTLGLVDDAVLESVAYGGRARVAFLNVPSGTYTLTVLYPDPLDPAAQLAMTTTVTTVADGANLVRVGGNTGPTPPPAGAYTFTEDVYPILQKASQGGDGCANCHTLGGVANFLRFDEGAAIAYQAIIARPGVVNVLEPAASLLLTKPMYEDPPNHPNATWLDALDPSYQIVLAWIAQGALQ